MTTKQRTLIVLPLKIHLDQYLALIVYTNYLIKKNQNIKILATSNLLDKFKSSAILNESIEIIHKLDKQKFIIQFPGQKGEIENIQWTQNQDILSIYINMTKSEFNAKSMKLIKLPSEFTKIIFFDVESLNELEKFFTDETKYILDINNIISIGKSTKNVQIQKAYTDETVMSIAEIVFNLLMENNYKFDEQEANFILASIFFATQRFAINLKSHKTYDIASKLVKFGAKNEKAKNIIKQK